MNLKDYQSQIKELIALRHKPDFNELLNKILFGESSSDKFLLKMELNRLTKPSRRIIDLRDNVNEDCRIYQCADIKHYLTTDAIKVLEESIKLHGLYSEGVVEAVYAHIAQQKEQKNKKLVSRESQKTANQCEFIQLSQRNMRAATRMFFVSDVHLVLAGDQQIQAQTSNISVTGVKLKLQEEINISSEQNVKLVFQSLQREYQEPVLSEKITYKIVKQAKEDNDHYLYLSYADEKKQFILFLKEFIKRNKFKYKIDISYYCQLAKIRSLKNIYIAQMHTLPVYLNSNAASPFLFSLINNNNKKIIKEFSCNGVNQLPLLFSELRLAKLLAYASKQAVMTLYCFTHENNGKNYFISATEDELQEKGLKALFITYGSSKTSWRVYHLTLNTYRYQQIESYDITEPVPASFQNTTHIATLQPLPSLPSFTINQEINKKDLNKINQFIHRIQDIKEATIFTLFSNEQRKEPRYRYNSQLSISTNDTHYTGELIDFSCSGLKIKLEQIAVLPQGSVINVNFTELQKISKKLTLSNLRYKVVRSSAPRTLHLQVSDIKTMETCEHFFSLLVKNNPKHFEFLPLKTNKQPAIKRLTEISEGAFINSVFFIGKKAGRPEIKIAAIDHPEHPLQKLFSLRSDKSSEINYYPLINNNLYERLIALPFKKCQPGKLYKEALIYIKAYKYTNKKWLINSFLDSDFKSEQEKITFIKQSNEEALFYALHYRLSGIHCDNLSSIQTEIRAISRIAVHLRKKLEAELNDINAMIEITDRTAAILQAMPDTKQITDNR